MRAVLFLLLAATAAPAAWKAGASKVEITPKEPVWLAGYGSRTQPSEGVRQPIYVKALALEDSTGARSLLLTFDLLGLDRGTARIIAESVQKRFGIPRERVAMVASHTHSAPVAGTVLLPAYPLEASHVAVIERYTDWMLERVTEASEQAVRALAPATLHFGQGFAGFAVNRRRVGNRARPGPVDHDVPVLGVKGSEGRWRAIVFGYACHATVLSDNQVSGDWPGYAQAAIERDHPGAVALFVTGAGADSNPLPRRAVALAERYGETLGYEVADVLKQKLVDVAEPLRAAYREVDLPFSEAPKRAIWEDRAKTGENHMVRNHARAMLAMIERDGKLPERYPYPVQVWRFGNQMKMIILGGELVVDFAHRFKGEYGADDTWIAGYANDVFAYIPSLRVLREGGYEGGGAMIPYGQPSPFRWPVEEIIAETVDQLITATAAP